MHKVVMAAVEDLGYRPDMLAQGLRRGKTLSVGFTVSDISNPVLAQAVTGAERRLRAEGYTLLLTNSEGDPALDSQHLSLLLSRRVDGLLLSLADESHPMTLRALESADVPIILVDRDVPEGVEASSVAFDHAAGMREATTHLVNLGHRRVAFITGGPARPARQRRTAVEEVLREAGATLTVHEVDFTVQQGQQAAREIIASPHAPTAIIAGGNMLMHGALLAMRDAGVVVGREMSFVGCDDVPAAELHTPPIAIVRRDMTSIGAAAAGVLLAELKRDENEPPIAPRHEPAIILPTEFVPRASCGSAPKA
jgi:LacI family transcriptional regulator